MIPREATLIAMTLTLVACNGGTGVGELCAGRECGEPRPGVSCGTCPGETEVCDALGQCVDLCEGRECGEVSGLFCGTCPGETEVCDALGQCLDVCNGLECGEGAPGVSCGTCLPPQQCSFLGQCFGPAACPAGMVPAGETGLCIQALETTNASYLEFLQTHGNVCKPGALPPTDKCIWDDPSHPYAEDYHLWYHDGEGWQVDPGYEEIPVVGVTWWGSRGYCEHQGWHLCTGEEWLMSCQGPEGHVFPYGDTYDPVACNTESAIWEPVAVGSYPACEGGYAGLFDMSGNVEEWVDDCTEYSNTSCHVAGGKYAGMEDTFQCDFRDRGTSSATNHFPGRGFRCCYHLQ